MYVHNVIYGKSALKIIFKIINESSSSKYCIIDNVHNKYVKQKELKAVIES